MTLSEERINNMPAIQLANGQEIQGSSENSHPSRASDGMQVDIGAGDSWKIKMFEETQQQGRSEHQVPVICRSGNDTREVQAHQKNGHQSDESRNGPGYSDIE